MTLRVLAAVTGSPWEAALVAALEADASGVEVVRRCVDLADLLAAAAVGTAEAALVGSEMRRLDRDALAQLAAARVAVVGLVSAGDDPAEARLRALGVRQVLSGEAAGAEIGAAVAACVEDLRADPDRGLGLAFADPAAALPDPRPGGDAPLPELHAATAPATGRLVAVWGPAGAPGRSTLGLALGADLAQNGEQVVLADADTYGGAQATLLGLLDESSGLAAACRLANLGTLDLLALGGVAPLVAPRLRVLTGLGRPERWPELRPSSLEQVWALCRRLSTWTIVDCGFSLEHDEELAFDTMAPRRNGATLATLAAVDVVVAVGAADPVGVQRLVRGLDRLREVVPAAAPVVVVNRVRASVTGAGARRQLGEALQRYADVADPVFVPDDPRSFDTALRTGRSLVEAAPDSPARDAVRELALRVTGRPAVRRRGRRSLGMVRRTTAAGR